MRKEEKRALVERWRVRYMKEEVWEEQGEVDERYDEQGVELHH